MINFVRGQVSISYVDAVPHDEHFHMCEQDTLMHTGETSFSEAEDKMIPGHKLPLTQLGLQFDRILKLLQRARVVGEAEMVDGMGQDIRETRRKTNISTIKRRWTLK